MYGTLDTLENLQKGGRVGNARALLGTLLSFKPGIEVRDGRGRGGRQAPHPARRRCSGWPTRCSPSRPSSDLWVMHGQAPDLDDFLALISSRFPPSDIQIGIIGPVVATHGGPRVMGVCFLQ